MNSLRRLYRMLRCKHLDRVTTTVYKKKTFKPLYTEIEICLCCGRVLKAVEVYSHKHKRRVWYTDPLDLPRKIFKRIYKRR